jgi:hypothetical protein
MFGFHLRDEPMRGNGLGQRRRSFAFAPTIRFHILLRIVQAVRPFSS